MVASTANGKGQLGHGGLSGFDQPVVVEGL